jgi:hypothetical protein
VGVLNGESLPSGGGVLDRGLDQCNGFGFASSQPGEQQRAVGRDAGSGRLSDRIGFGGHQRGRPEIAAPCDNDSLAG